MMHHFLDHYLHHIGVWPTHTRFVLQQPQNVSLLNRTLEALASAGVPEHNVTVHHGRYSDRIKLDATNAFIDRLSPGSLLINADGDELFSYPCHYEVCLHHYGSCCATFRDRMATSGRVMDLQYSPSIYEQFPLECSIRQKLGGFTLDKHILLDPYHRGFGAQFLTSHRVGWFYANGTRTRQLVGSCKDHHTNHLSPHHVAHFTLTTAQVDMVKQKALNWSPTGDNGQETYGCWRTINDRVRSGNESSNRTACVDYLNILKWMKSKRDTRNWCTAPENMSRHEWFVQMKRARISPPPPPLLSPPPSSPPHPPPPPWSMYPTRPGQSIASNPGISAMQAAARAARDMAASRAARVRRKDG